MGIEESYNPVAFIKEFMEKESYINEKYANMSAIDTAKKNIVADYIDGEYVEIDR